MIEQAVHDARFCKGNNKASAVKFLSSDTYETICTSLNLPADTIRNSIYDTRHNPSEEREGRQAKKVLRLQEVQGELRLDFQEEGGTEK